MLGVAVATTPSIQQVFSAINVLTMVFATEQMRLRWSQDTGEALRRAFKRSNVPKLTHALVEEIQVALLGTMERCATFARKKPMKMEIFMQDQDPIVAQSAVHFPFRSSC